MDFWDLSYKGCPSKNASSVNEVTISPSWGKLSYKTMWFEKSPAHSDIKTALGLCLASIKQKIWKKHNWDDKIKHLCTLIKSQVLKWTKKNIISIKINECRILSSQHCFFHNFCFIESRKKIKDCFKIRMSRAFWKPNCFSW